MGSGHIMGMEFMDRKTDPTLPAASLLRSWGKRLAKGNVPVIPVFVGGSWSLQVPRGNKRVLRVPVSKSQA